MMGNEELSRLLTDQYPLVHRVARGLCGDDLAPAVTHTVFVKSVRASDHWRNQESAANWFLRQTLLQGRNATVPRKINPIWRGPAAERVEVRAILKVFSTLPFQQREAFLLGRGERLDIQRTAIAMDCSTTAATQHLAAAEKTLATFGGPDTARWTGLLLEVYSSPPPAGNLVIARTVRRNARRRFIRGMIRIAAVILVILAAWVVWRIYRMLDY